MLIPKISALYESSLASALSDSGSSFTVVSGNDRDGNALSGLYGFIIDEGTANEEFVIGTIASGTVSIIYRGIDADAPNTEVTANKKTHRRGSSVKITDYPITGILRNLLNGDDTLPNLLKYAPSVVPLSADDLVDKGYVDGLQNGGTLSYDRIIIGGTAGETIASGNLVYLKASDGRWWLCDADTAATVENIILGIAQGAGTAGVAVASGVLIQGVASNLTGLTANTKYYASNTAGGLSTTTGTTEVTVGYSLSTTSLMFFPQYDQQITEDIQDALAGGSTFGTPSASNKFITQSYNSGATGLPVRRVYSYASAGSSTTQFDITNPSGTTFRYTYDGTGTDPVINATTFPVGSTVMIVLTNTATYANSGTFTVTNSGTNFFEVTNASGVAENNKTLSTDGFLKVATNASWSKPAGLKYVQVEVIGGGGGGGGTTTGSTIAGGGGGGGYSKELIAAATLGSTEALIVGGGGKGGNGASTTDGSAGGTSSFGTSPYLQATGGAGGVKDSGAGGLGGVGSNGDMNVAGSPGEGGATTLTTAAGGGGSSTLGGGAISQRTTSGATGNAGRAYGGGGGGASSSAGAEDAYGGPGEFGLVVVTEYYS